jgi:hypothetical protein
LNQP